MEEEGGGDKCEVQGKQKKKYKNTVKSEDN